MTAAEQSKRRTDDAVRLGIENMQMIVMLTKCERYFASIALSAAFTLPEKAAALAMCREIKALRTKVES